MAQYVVIGRLLICATICLIAEGFVRGESI